MHIHEHQAKDLLKQFGIAVPKGAPLFSVSEASVVFDTLFGFSSVEESPHPVWVLKAQVHTGGRGKAGGIKLGRTKEEFETAVQELMGKKLITPQTGKKDKIIRRLYVEEALPIEKEVYLSLLLDRVSSQISIMVSEEGGTDIEEIALHAPDKIKKLSIDPSIDWSPFYGRLLAEDLGIEGNAQKNFIDLLHKIYRVYQSLDASLIEINPLVITKNQDVIPLDAKMTFDDNALFRHPELLVLRDVQEEDPLELEAASYSLNYVKLEGNIGCMVNGAGLAIATMDILKLQGGQPANFLDVGGGATKETISAAFQIILSDPSVKGILINIFGGIMRCDLLAEGIVNAAKEKIISIPIVARLAGTNVEEGNRILESSSLSIITASDLEEAAERIVSAVARKN